jgi:hypothetical protein
LGVLPVFLLSLRDPEAIRAAVEIGVREAFDHCPPDILASFAAAVGGEIPPLDQPLKLSPAAERGAFDLLKRQERDPRLRVRGPVAQQMLGVGQSKLFELMGAGLLDSVMGGAARLITTDSIYRLLIRDVVLSHPYGAPARKAVLPWASFKTHGRVDGRKLRKTRTEAEKAALARANQRRKEEAAARRAGQGTEAI